MNRNAVLNVTGGAVNETFDDGDVDNLTRSIRGLFPGRVFPYPSLHSWEHIVSASLAVSVIMAAIVFGNGLVVLAISTDRSLKGFQNWFVASLAVSDLLVGLFIMPLSLANELMGYWYFGDAVCELWLSTDVLLCTASILNLCLISLDRYWSITRAISYIKQRTRNRTIAMISTVWILSMTICFPPLVGWKRPQPRLDAGYPLCILSEEPGYVMYSSVGSFYLPLIVMVLVYFKIYRAARKRARRNLTRSGPRPIGRVCRSRFLRSKNTFTTSVSQSDGSETPGNKSRFSTFKKSAIEGSLPVECTDKGELNVIVLPHKSSSKQIDVTTKEQVQLEQNAAKTDEKETCMKKSRFENVHKTGSTGTIRECPEKIGNTVEHGNHSGDDEFSQTEDSDFLHQHPHHHHHHHRHHSHQQTPVISGKAVYPPRLALQLLVGRYSLHQSSSSSSSSSSTSSSQLPTTSHIRRAIGNIPGDILQYIPALLSNRLVAGHPQHQRGPSHPPVPVPAPPRVDEELRRLTVDRTRRRAARAKERRAIVVLGVVMASFVGCWLPFFAVYPITSVSGIRVPSGLFAVIFWLGYCNSALNPVIYTIFNQDFRNAFTHILFRRRNSYRHTC